MEKVRKEENKQKHVTVIPAMKKLHKETNAYGRVKKKTSLWVCKGEY